MCNFASKLKNGIRFKKIRYRNYSDVANVLSVYFFSPQTFAKKIWNFGLWHYLFIITCARRKGEWKIVCHVRCIVAKKEFGTD